MIKSRAFIIGFLGGLLLLAVIYIYTYDGGAGGATIRDGVRMVECFDCLKQVGWPFRLHKSGTFAHVDEFLWPGLIADILLALFMSTVVGLVCKGLAARARVIKQEAAR